MPQRLRVFISSPGDVRDAREIAAQTVESIAPDYQRYFELAPYLWESEVLLASGHFQDSIEPPSQFDIVALIVWSRLGTPLPAQTAVRQYVGIDGRSPVTGTEWEFEDALAAAREHGSPEMLVYRSARPASVDAWDAARRQDGLDQLAALDRFWTRHFADKDGFIAAYHSFTSLDEFAADFGARLRALLDRRVAAGRTGAATSGATRLWTKAPFRGLDAFEFEDGPVYFGRAKAVGKALTQLIGNAEAGLAFLLILAASGSGKSSLAKAGLAPRLLLPHRIVGKGFLRRVVFRVGDGVDAGADVFDALAAALVSPKAGTGVGLPELGRADRLARIFREAPGEAPLFIDGVLDQLTTDGRAAGALLGSEDATVVLILDQLEQLFTNAAIAPADRVKFIALIEALARGGRVWVVATMRADFWHRASEVPALVGLAEGSGRFDLLPPSGPEILQMIRLPAQAANLEFEVSDDDSVSLDQRIAEEATDGPGALPLLSYLLEQLYRADVLEGGGSRLSFATYARLGGFRGAVSQRAEQVFTQQDAAVQAALRSVIFSLVQVSNDASGGLTVTARQAELASFDADPAARRLVEAYLDPAVRLLLADRDASGVVTVRVCHEALFKEWTRARDAIAEDVALLAIRRRVEDRFSRWRAGPASGAAGLLTEIDLEEAIRLRTAYGTALPGDLTQYIDLSQRSHRRRQRRAMMVMGAVTGAMSLLAVAAAGFAIFAYSQANYARIQLLARSLVDDQADGDAAIKAHDLPGAIAQYGDEVAAGKTLVASDPGNPQWSLNLAAGEARLGFVLKKRAGPGDAAAAHADFVAASQLATSVAALPNAPARVHTDSQQLQSQLASYLAP